MTDDIHRNSERLDVLTIPSEQVTRAQCITVASTRVTAHDIHWTSDRPDVLTIGGATVTISSVRRMMIEIASVCGVALHDPD